MSMDFIDQVKQFSKRVESLKDNIQTEEATKTSIIMPFFAMLGYDVFNPSEFVPEFTADVGIKKGEKVDYAILNEGSPVILIEAKWIGEKLEAHDSQLFRYFGTTTAKFGILTNGIIYRFFTDLEEPNKMDSKPFFEFNLLDIKETQVSELKKFHKSVFNLSDVIDTASELKYVREFKTLLAKELQSPSDAFVKHFLTPAYSGKQTQAVIEKFRPILKKSLNDHITEIMNDKIKLALGAQDTPPTLPSEAGEQPVKDDAPLKNEPRITTTQDELEAFFVIRNLLRDVVPVEDITHKDTESYFGVLYKNNTRKWICRVCLNSANWFIIVPDENKKDQKFPISSVYDIEAHKEILTQVLKRYL